jgi:hypothetical protein
MVRQALTIELTREGPLLISERFRDAKDPCPVFDGEVWHLFGSGGNSRTETWQILHATAPGPEGPWTERDPVMLIGLKGDHVAAPGVVYDGGRFHLFIQTEFFKLDGTVEYLTSTDGSTFTREKTALRSLPGTDEAGIYDPHPAVIGGVKYLTYSGNRAVSRPDLYLARSLTNSWAGPWWRCGRILTHQEVSHHNQPDDPTYEWGLEGSQLLELPSGEVLLNAVCFLPHLPHGRRQRVFLAVAEHVKGPYRTLGPLLEPSPQGWESGENGHATAIISGERLMVYYQARGPAAGDPWRYGRAVYSLDSLESFLEALKTYQGLREAVAGAEPVGANKG